VADDRFSTPGSARPAPPVGKMPVTDPRIDAKSIRAMQIIVTAFRNWPPLALVIVDISISVLGLVVVSRESLPDNKLQLVGLLLVIFLLSFGISGIQWYLFHAFANMGRMKFIFSLPGAGIALLWLFDQLLDAMGYTLFTTRNFEWASSVLPPWNEMDSAFKIGYGVVFVVGLISEWLLAYRIRLGTMYA
jgi:hypothetical protein